MSIAVNFNYQQWAARYPEFDQDVVTEAVAQELFNEATLSYQDNSGAPGGIWNSARQLTLLNMLVAHLAFLYFGTRQNGNEASPLVGRVDNAAQGSVSVHAENDYPPGTVQWFQSTRYGASWWVATAPLRTMRYIVTPRRFGPGPPGFGGWGWYGGIY